ncbi:MAG: hypothetical protein ACRCXT_14595 [Paraclostridium sp.]
MKNKTKFIISLCIVVTIIVVVIFNLNISKVPEKPTVMYENTKFAFIGDTVELSSSEIVNAGSTKSEVKEMPKENFTAFKIKDGTNMYTLKISSDKEDLYGYIFIKDKNSDLYNIGFPYYANDDEKDSITKYLDKKEEEYKAYRNK